MKKIRYIAIILVFSLLIGGTSLLGIAKSDEEISAWERRRLQQLPELSWSSLQSGDFMKNFESYLSDQFPLRDSLRRLKARIHFNVLGQKDNSGIYIAEGHAGKLDPVLNDDLVQGFTDKVTELYDTYLAATDCKVYYSVIPDKNYFLAEKNGYPAFDYAELFGMVDKNLRFMTKIDISELIEIEDYYTTDTHWKQESITDVAHKIRTAMGMKSDASYEEKSVGEFYGVYYGQSALPLEADEIKYLTNEELELCTVFNAETQKNTRVYDMEKLQSMDLYDVFLSGAVSFMEISNPTAKTGRELVIFRDSFGSSLAPLLLSGYEKVTLIDTRYIMPELVGEYITFKNQDVLFIYSTLLINSSGALK
ncbi:MAG: hypothetical protein IJ491_09395 [Clostridia bacterium]|nr:hypothetical protein [Clostridia bacterium]